MHRPQRPQNGKQDFRLLLVLPHSRQILALRDTTCPIPRVSVPEKTRTAQFLTNTLQKQWGHGFVAIDFLPNKEGLGPLAVLEVRSQSRDFHVTGLRVAELSELQDEITTEELSIVDRMLVGDTEGRGIFSRIGWIDDTQKWMRQSLGEPNLHFNQNIQQIHAGGSFTLLRLQTQSGVGYWLKAVAAPNLAELPVTRLLSRLCAGFVPCVIATRDDWNAWVMEEAGIPLENCFGQAELEESARSLAELQIRTIPHIGDLLDAGCHDLRTPVLRKLLPSLVQYLKEAMARQTSTKVLPVPPSQLERLCLLLDRAAQNIEALAVPDTVIHNDMNLGNILINNSNAVFIDWSTACVGNPFLTFHHLQAYAAESEQFCRWMPRLRQIYAKRWNGIIQKEKIARVIALSGPLAIASYIIGRDPSLSSSSISPDHVESYTRSLTRTMNRLSGSPEFLEALSH